MRGVGGGIDEGVGSKGDVAGLGLGLDTAEILDLGACAEGDVFALNLSGNGGDGIGEQFAIDVDTAVAEGAAGVCLDSEKAARSGVADPKLDATGKGEVLVGFEIKGCVAQKLEIGVAVDVYVSELRFDEGRRGEEVGEDELKVNVVSGFYDELTGLGIDG